VNPARVGTKAAAHYDLKVFAGKSVTVQMRLTKVVGKKSNPADDFSSMFAIQVEPHKPTST
jgi:hypothetical protein